MIRLLLPVVALLPFAQADLFPLQISHRARALTAGEIVLVEVRSRTPLAQLQGEAFGRPIVFYQAAPDRWQALAAIDLATRAGQYTVRVKARSADGGTLVGSQPVALAQRTFPTRRLSVAPEFAAPAKDVLTRIERERRAVEAIFSRTTPDRFWSGAFLVPVPGTPTSSFGRRSIVNGEPRSPHSGTDFQAADGTAVVAPNRGRVALAGDLYFAGKTIVIDHGAGLYSYLAHLSEMLVAEGDMIDRGQKIALSGSTGRVTGPHLHWTMRIGPARVDPLSLVFLLKGADAPRAPSDSRGRSMEGPQCLAAARVTSRTTVPQRHPRS
jgi:murein DD-endopeptidase MepM/ murein hydrolase activator NlpD